jgi:hypothetical protein
MKFEPLSQDQIDQTLQVWGDPAAYPTHEACALALGLKTRQALLFRLQRIRERGIYVPVRKRAAIVEVSRD